MSRSPIQRFISELRRRHVPQTAAIYLVAAWAAIQFADVVVPNLNGPQWVVTAVIVAALVGLPVMLVAAWVFEWGPEGIHRTQPGEAGTPPEGSSPRPEGGYATGASTGTKRPQPWLVAVAVLVVGIGSAVGVTFVLRGTGAGETAAPVIDSAGTTRVTDGQAGGEPGRPPPVPGIAVPELGELGVGLADSIRNQLIQAMEVLDSVNLGRLAELGRAAAAETGLGIVISQPEGWRVGSAATTPGVPVPLAEGDTLVVEGVVVDTTGVVLVIVDGRAVAEADPPKAALRFTTPLVGRGSAGTRTVVITAQTAHGQEIRKEYQIIQLPGGTP